MEKAEEKQDMEVVWYLSTEVGQAFAAGELDHKPCKMKGWKEGLFREKGRADNSGKH